MKNTADPTGYMICTSPRSGSTLLCAMLKAAGAGAPASLFYETAPDGWARRLDVAGDPGDPEVLRALFAAALDRGRGGTGTFGLRQQRGSFAALTAALARAFPDEGTDLARLTRSFGPLRLIHLHRRDKVAQAVSLLRAETTGLWHLGSDGTVVERSAPDRPDGFDGAQIAETVAMLEGYEDGWTTWFAATGAAPLRLTYEDLAADARGEVARVLASIGLPGDAARDIAVPLAKLAEAGSADRIARYRASDPIGFRALTQNDLGTLEKWLTDPRNAELRGGPGEMAHLEDHLTDPRVAQWMVTKGDEDVAYIQDYDIHGFDDHPLAALPPGARGIDTFIGSSARMGRGLGPAYLRLHALRLFAAGVPALGIDPDPGNAAAIRAYEKAGFGGEEVVETPWGIARVMTRWPQ